MGDKVSVLDEDLNGIVTNIVGDTIRIEDADGFELNFDRSEIVKTGDGSVLRTNVFSHSSFNEVASQKEVRNKKSVKIRKKERIQPTMEVDLHVHQLTNNTKGLTKHDMLNLQMDTAKRQLEFAIRKNIQRIVFIHGVGEGVLKLELEYLFKRYDNVNYYDANYQKYGLGATEVYIQQNAGTI